MKKPIKVLSLGAVLWDVVGKNEYIGGAPFNWAVNMARLGAESALVTAVGADARGERAVHKIKEYGVSERFVQIAEGQCTGYAEAKISPNKDAVYHIPHAAFDEIRATDETLETLNAFAPDVVYFGSFEQRNEITRGSVQKILNEVHSEHIFFDVNIRMNFIDKEVLSFGLKKSDVVKLNEEESARISSLFYGKEWPRAKFAKILTDDFGIACLIITMGEKGCFVYADGKEFYGAPVPSDAEDTIGAGDAFSAAFLSSYLSDEGVQTAADKGNILGSYVAGKAGALPEWDDRIRKLLEAE